MSKTSKEHLLECARPIIAIIAKNRRNQKFAYYEDVDIEQEVWVLCLQALENYNPDKASQNVPLAKQIEHFLNHHVSNRLKNLMRDKYFRPESDESRAGHAQARMNLVNALPLDICDENEDITVLGSANRTCDPVAFSIAREMRDLIISKLSEDLIEPFTSLLGGNKLKKALEMRLQEEVAEILQELDDVQ